MAEFRAGATPSEFQLLAEELVLELPAVEQVLADAARAAASTAQRSCGITYRTVYGVLSVASSDARASSVDEVQYSAGDGPCLQAMRTGEPVRVDDVLREMRWPGYSALATAAGIRSSLSYPVIIEGKSVGALNVYSTLAEQWPAEDEAAVLLLSHQVAGILEAVQEIAADIVRDPVDAQALVDRRNLDIATGVLMARHHCSEAEGREMIEGDAHRLRISTAAVVTTLLAAARADAEAGADADGTP